MDYTHGDVTAENGAGISADSNTISERVISNSFVTDGKREDVV